MVHTFANPFEGKIPCHSPASGRRLTGKRALLFSCGGSARPQSAAAVAGAYGFRPLVEHPVESLLDQLFSTSISCINTSIRSGVASVQAVLCPAVSGSLSPSAQIPRPGAHTNAIRRQLARQKKARIWFFLFQYRIIRLSHPVALELFPDGCHTAAVVLAAAPVVSFRRHGSGRVKQHARGLMGTKKDGFLLLVQMVGALSAAS